MLLIFKAKLLNGICKTVIIYTNWRYVFFLLDILLKFLTLIKDLARFKWKLDLGGILMPLRYVIGTVLRSILSHGHKCRYVQGEPIIALKVWHEPINIALMRANMDNKNINFH